MQGDLYHPLDGLGKSAISRFVQKSKGARTPFVQKHGGPFSPEWRRKAMQELLNRSAHLHNIKQHAQASAARNLYDAAIDDPVLQDKIVINVFPDINKRIRKGEAKIKGKREAVRLRKQLEKTRAQKSELRNVIDQMIQNNRPLDPVTKVGTIIEQEANAPVIIKAIESPTGETLVETELLPYVSPLDVERYEADPDQGLIYPVMKKEGVASDWQYFPPSYADLEAEPNLIGGSDFGVSYWNEGGDYLDMGEWYGMGAYSELSGLFSILATAAKTVKAVVMKPIKFLRRRVIPGKQRELYKASKGVRAKLKTGLTPGQIASIKSGGKVNMPGGPFKGKLVGMTELVEIAKGTLPPGALQAAMAAAANGDVEGLTDLIETNTPGATGGERNFGDAKKAAPLLLLVPILGVAYYAIK